jgi:F-type H+-transporting ATPase subunit a
MKAWFGGLSTKRKVLLILAVYFAGVIALGILIPSQGKNDDFQPQNEFKLENWINLHIGGIDFSITRAVLYLFLASGLTILCMVWISRRMQMKPNKVQTTVELAYDLTRNNITGGNMDGKLAARWFPFLATLFFFIWFSNMIGYIPLPTNSAETFDVFGLAIPTFAIYAATANISIPLALTLVVWVSYHVEGIKAKGFFGYLKSWLPAGIEYMPFAFKAFVFVIECISHFVRLISLSVRLFANILAGHLLLLFMGGGLAVLLGLAALGALTFPMAFVFFVFEVGLVATLQAFIFSTLTSIYIGGAVADTH